MVHSSSARPTVNINSNLTLDKTLHLVTPNFNNWSIAAKHDTHYLVPFFPLVYAER